MNRLTATLLVAVFTLLMPAPAAAQQQEVRDVDITMDITSNGALVIEEIWDINTGTGITEWYLVRENLGDIDIPILYVTDENEHEFEDVGEWNVKLSREQKAGKSGIVHKKNGMELCWGIGSYGDHTYHVVYGMTKAVKSLNDYDMLHLQVVSPGLSSPPQHVRVTVQAQDFQLDTLNTRLWAFGYEGYANVEDGKAVFESDAPLETDDSVIILLRFEKGLFQPQSVQKRDFQTVLKKAFKGSDYSLTEEKTINWLKVGAWILGILLSLLGIRFLYVKWLDWSYLKTIFKGFKRKQVSWFRDIPLDGNLEAADNVLRDLFEKPEPNLPVAEILRMINLGLINVTRDIDGPVKLTFPGAKATESLSESSRALLQMLRQAAEKNKGVLQDSDFSYWLSFRKNEADKWNSLAKFDAEHYLLAKKYYARHAYTPEGVEQTRRLLGLKKFLDEFTLSNEREAIDVHVWKDYLVYAALFGIADKVSRQLKDIDPDLFQVYTSASVVVTNISRQVKDAARDVERLRREKESFSSSSSSSSHSRSSGGGGRSSRGGGGGYSGGGRGGGGR